MNPGNEITLHLHPLPSGEAVEIRLRRALKTLLRRDRFRCREFSWVADTAERASTGNGASGRVTGSEAPPADFNQYSNA